MPAAIAQLVLIAGLVLCPFRCEVNHLACAGDAASHAGERQCGCRNCHSAEHNPAEPSPHRGSDQDAPPDGHCQCICAGAVIDKSDRADLLDGLHIAAAADAVCPVVAFEMAPRPPAGPPLRVPGMNTGRGLCTLHSLLLC